MERLYGLLGRKLGHSWSAPIHRALGCESYRMVEVEPEDLAAFLSREDIGGLNVTIPYKKDVIPLCREVDEEAKAIGSVNTLVKGEDGALRGYNTDIDGFRLISRLAGADFSGKKVVVLGTGGASLTVQAAARKAGAREIAVISRTGPDNYENLAQRHSDADILVNATPVGMWPRVEERPVDLGIFLRLSAVLDLIYNPLRTGLLLQAQELGIPCCGGLPMLVEQAVKAEERFFGRTFPRGTGEKILSDLWRQRANIVLVGMPGSGKSTVGKQLAKKTGRPLIDLDEEIARRAGKPIPDIFREEGETAFRELEGKLLAEFSDRTGQIIATGGGAVLRPENRTALRRTGRVYWLHRDLSALPTHGRPLSQGADLEEMYRARRPLYAAAADRTVESGKTAEETAGKIWRDFCAYPGY